MKYKGKNQTKFDVLSTQFRLMTEIE